MLTSQRGRLAAATALLLLTAACNFPVVEVQPIQGEAPTATPFQPGADAALEVDFGKSEANTWWLDPALPEGLVTRLSLPDNAQLVENRDEAALVLSIADGQPVGHWVYALVAAFPTLTDGVDFDDLLGAWRGESSQPLMMSAETQAALSALWGAGDGVELLAADELLEAAWAAPGAWAIVPFEVLQPRWKVLAVDGLSPIWKDFYAGDYELALPIGLMGDADQATVALDSLAFKSNRDPGKLTTVAITGVTALVRATAYTMEQQGMTYPAEEIGDLLREADITHISNEVAFSETCPEPDPVQRSMIFCSDPRYIELMEAVGTDVVELTGDHFNDWGASAMYYTLDLYAEHGWAYYGGGHSLEEGRAALLLEHNDNRIAFIGCNGKGGGFASAAEDHPGAVSCDYEWIAAEVQRLHDEGYLVIVTFQHNETYTYIPQPNLIRDFNKVAEGAAVVSGSQAHQPHGMQFPDDNTLITYGLGNTFFDQVAISDATAQGIIARHVMYDGRYISTELFTIQFVDFAKPRFMTQAERNAFLSIIFDVSLWEH